ncbi:MAG: TaqI-like C-terminal specificity domain-containing protein, partial [Thermotogota bacterium]|nr:TaqI-like C-terminal specificity domain-containing protein [Thermotogota bacterium]
PNRFCASDSASRLREIIINTINSGEIISTSQIKVFEASNYPVISILNKAKTGEMFLIRQIKNLSQLVKSIEFLEKKYYAYRSHFELFPNKVIPININQFAFNLVIRLYAEKQIMAKYLYVSEGLRIPSKLETESIDDLKIVKQYQFIRYSTIKDGSFITIKNFSKIISSKSDRYNRIFSEKILIAEDALQITATIDEDKCVPQGGVYFATLTSKKLSIKFFLGLLNSKLLSYIYEALYAGMHMGGGYMRYRSKFLENLPVPEKIETVYAEKINTIVDKILFITKDYDYLQNQQKQARAKELEREIDQLVYKLYELTEEEIRIVEGEK